MKTREQMSPWRAVPALAEILNAGSKHQTWTVPAIRNLLARRHENGLASCCRKIGQKLLVSEPGFVRWLETQADADQRAA